MSDATMTVEGSVVTHLVRPGETIRLSFVPDDEVPEAHRRMVRHHVDQAAGLLGLGSVGIRYFGPAVGAGDFEYTGDGTERTLVLGATSSPAEGELAIRLPASLRGEPLVAAVCAHEVRHVYQNIVLRRMRAELERMAADFEALQDAFERLVEPAAAEGDAEGFMRAYVRALEGGPR